MQSVHPEVHSYLDQVVTTLTIYLGADLIGVYLHGSLAMGSFDPGRSDIDILAVCAEPLHHERRTVLGEALAAIPTPPSGGDLEFSLVTEAAVRARSTAPSFEVHVNTHEEPFVVDGSDRPGDQDLVIHFAMVRARGRALIGPEPAELFLEPVRDSLIQAFLGDIQWAKEEGAAAWEGHDRPKLASVAYQVLNAARCWRYLESGELGSKVEGAGWLERRDPDPDTRALLDAALAYQRGAIPNQPDERTVRGFVERVEAMLRSAVS
jgi:predicted nucleotidyltransferase